MLKNALVKVAVGVPVTPETVYTSLYTRLPCPGIARLAVV